MDSMGVYKISNAKAVFFKFDMLFKDEGMDYMLCKTI